MLVSKTVKIWIIISAFIVIWDASFVLLKPHTLPGGKLHRFWQPYDIYTTIDTLYNDETDRFLKIQSVLNYIEASLSILFFLILLRKTDKLQIIGGFGVLIVSCFTFWKTVLYLSYDEAFVNYNNEPSVLIFLFLVPNMFWIVMPLFSIISISRRVYNLLTIKNKND